MTSKKKEFGRKRDKSPMMGFLVPDEDTKMVCNIYSVSVTVLCTCTILFVATGVLIKCGKVEIECALTRN